MFISSDSVYMACSTPQHNGKVLFGKFCDPSLNFNALALLNQIVLTRAQCDPQLHHCVAQVPAHVESGGTVGNVAWWQTKVGHGESWQSKAKLLRRETEVMIIVLKSCP